MEKKYIDADKLLKAIEENKDELKMAFLFCPTFARKKVQEGFDIAVGIINSFIEQEQPEEDSQGRTEEDVYEVNNPYWRSDVFVFQRKHLKNFLYGEIESVCYIKINNENRIEEIGFDFSKRFHLEKGREYPKATPSHKKTFLRIDDALWLRLYRQERYYQERRNDHG